MEAAYNGHPSIVLVLLQHFLADLDLQTLDGFAAPMSAAYRGQRRA